MEATVILIACADCQAEFEYVPKHAAVLKKFCDDCLVLHRRAARRRADVKNPEAKRAGRQRWIENNPEEARAVQRRWKEKNAERMRQWHSDHHRLKKYGLTREALDELIRAQDNACAICGSQFGPGAAMNVDHDHATGTVRALLCQPCNAGLGLFMEDAARLEGAIRYLQQHKGVRTTV